MKIDHLGVAVHDLEAAIQRWQGVLGLELAHREVVRDQGVEVAKLPVGESAVELICPVDQTGSVAKFLEKRGDGLHHVCFAVADLEGALSRLKQAGVRLVDDKPRIGAGGDLIAFIHPSATNGVLTELKQAR
jgi:methylmalonyl-CoA/ethylmalonyl-CoA epimerase